MPTRITTTFLALGLGTALLAGCGGGGGGGTSSVTYTGVTTQAVITSENAETLLDSSMNASGGVTSVYGVATSTDETSQSGLSLPTLAKLLVDIKDRPKTTAPNLAAGINWSVSDTVEGSCGGTASYSGSATYNEYPYSYTEIGTATYNNYCEVTADGNVILNGSETYNLVDSDTELNIDASTSNLTVSFGGESITYNMEYAVNVAYSTGTLTYNMDADYRTQDGKVYRLEGYQLVLEGITTLTISGRFYHPDHGYVDITTPEAIQLSDCTGIYRPTAGVLRVTGAGQTALEAYAEFRPLSCSQYEICVSDGGLVCNTFPYPAP